LHHHHRKDDGKENFFDHSGSRVLGLHGLIALENDATVFFFAQVIVKAIAVCKRLTNAKAKPDTSYQMLD